MRSALALTGALAALAAGCGGSSASRPPIPTGKPTEEETRDAYLDTPVIVNDAAKRARPGITRARLAALMGGRASLGYARGGGRDCVVYPINGTQVWDAYGAPVAAEWEFCFGPHGRLVSKRRLPVGQ